MDAIIRQTVREEIRRQGESASTSSEAATRQPNQRTVSRLSGLLDRIRGQSRGKKRKSDKEHRIQVRWIHYDKKSKVFVPVRQKKGGGNSWRTEAKATALFFPDGKSAFPGSVDDMLLDTSICERSRAKHVFTWRQTSEFQVSNVQVFLPNCEGLLLDAAQREDDSNQHGRKKSSERRPTFNDLRN